MRLIFENSTVCHLVDGLVLYALIIFWFGFCFLRLTMILAFVLGFVFGWVKFSMESLILAQDERWRRA